MTDYDYMDPTPQSYDELDVDYEIIPPKTRVIVSVVIILLFFGMVCFLAFLGK